MLVITGDDRERLEALLARPDLPGDRRGHRPFVPADRFPTVESRRQGIYRPILNVWAQQRYLEAEPARPSLAWQTLVTRA